MLFAMLCSLCSLSFPSPWCSMDSCVFCENYTTQDTRYSMLQDVENQFLWSGYTSRPEFYKKHIRYMNRWCEKREIPTTAMELSYEQQLLKVLDWTRELWN